MDLVVAGRADHEGLSPPSGHELRPRGLWSSRAGEIGELADLVNADLARLLAQFAAARTEPGENSSGWDGSASLPIC